MTAPLVSGAARRFKMSRVVTVHPLRVEPGDGLPTDPLTPAGSLTSATVPALGTDAQVYPCCVKLGSTLMVRGAAVASR